MQKPTDTADLIRDGLNRGRIVMVLPGQHTVDRALTAPPLRTESSSLVAICRQLFALTLAESRGFVALLKYDRVTKEELRAVMDPDGKTVSNIVTVVLCRLRKKLIRHDIEIRNVRGLGYWLTDGARGNARRTLAAYGADIVDAVTTTESDTKP